MKGIALADAVDHVHRRELLESALARSTNAARYEGADLVTQAATLLWGLVRSHPFVDGNKRTALVATTAFLDINGYRLEMSDGDKFELIVSVANGELSVNEVADRLRPDVRPLQAPRTSQRRPNRRVPRRSRRRQGT